MSNWPNNVDYSHSNYTGRFPRASRYDGRGAWEKDSSKIPASAWACAAIVVVLLFAVLYIGAAVGF